MLKHKTMIEKTYIYTDASVKTTSKIITKIGFLIERNKEIIFQKVQGILENNINNAEMKAVEESIKFCEKEQITNFVIYTDSMHVINKNEFKERISNLKGEIKWVKAHNKSKGNKKVDKSLKHV